MITLQEQFENEITSTFVIGISFHAITLFSHLAHHHTRSFSFKSEIIIRRFNSRLLISRSLPLFTFSTALSSCLPVVTSISREAMPTFLRNITSSQFPSLSSSARSYRTLRLTSPNRSLSGLSSSAMSSSNSRSLNFRWATSV